MSDYLDQVVRFVCQCKFEDLPQSVVDRSKQVVADTLAVMVAGAQEEEVKKLTALLVKNGVANASSIIGAGVRSEALKASLINGTAGTFLELDEGNQFGRGHAAIQVIPAIFAVTEEVHLSGRDLITALVLGYEIGIRIGIACKLRMSMHPHGTWGTVGAAVSVGKLMGYREAEMRELISISASMSTATNRRTMLEGGTVRNLYSGLSSHNGLLAHYLIQSGFTGEHDGLKTVFGSVVSDTFDEEQMTAELGTRYEIARNYFKRYACCRYNHSAIDATNTILAQVPGGRILPDEIVSVEVMTYSLAAQLDSQSPCNMLAAKFSIPFAVATRIINGHAGISSFKPSAVQDPAIRALSLKVSVAEDPKLTAMMPKKRPSRVKIALTNGEVLTAEAFINKGDTEDPYTVEEMKEKYFELLDPVWGRGKAEELYGQVMDLDKISDFNQLTARMP